ncbi:hypothetical protein G432_10845 [Sphingomonas sp. MM-1]|uniref:glycosyltransferase 87 family protein n=1 Tax=Sphingomonas sp. MM-1 TaxID=745310 RepID=UPI0002C0DDA2|nr:glycosyltransferase 87 family protein [Sphingomonas sp. MM-1]AGH49892.1 hypothetical protein G432_10845 [Sphingomonas sp. MM-1]
MSGGRRAGRAAGLFAERALMLAVAASFGWLLWSFHRNGYLPQPFIIDTNDTFMDWFNTAYWANNPGAYDVWRTVYPPLSFLFLKLFSLPGCYLDSPFQARDCDWFGKAAILASYALGVALAWIAFRRADRATAPMRIIAFAIGLPMLFALERGNLILPCIACFVIAHGDIVRSKAWRGLAAALTINFKPYLLLPVLALAFKRRWRSLELAGIATLLVYLLTYAFVGAGSPIEIVDNMRNWVVTFVGGQVWEQIYYSTSYVTLLPIRTTPIPILDHIPSRTVETILWAVPILIRASQAAGLLCLAGAWLQPRALSTQRIAALLMAMSLVSQSPGGYTQAFLIFLVFLEPWRRPGPIVAIVAAYLLSISADWILSPFPEIASKSWLGGRPVTGLFGLSVGQFARPGLILLILWALAADSLWLIARAHRGHRPMIAIGPRTWPARPAVAR